MCELFFEKKNNFVHPRLICTFQKINLINQEISQKSPSAYAKIDAETRMHKFNMPSDSLTCGLLRTLAAIKPSGKFLELGTGSGLATSWILDGMDKNSRLVSIDNDEKLLAIAQTHLGEDSRLQLIHTDGEIWIKNNINQKFDYIFADTWHGKYLLLDEVLNMLAPYGIICCGRYASSA